MLRTVNRVLLGLLGLALMALGGSVLAVGLGVDPPSWWVHDGRHDVLLGGADRTRWRDEGWWWPTVIGVLALVVLLALWWLVAQLRRRRLADFLVETGDGEGALVRGRAMEDVLESDAGAVDGVARARVRLTGRRDAPEARVGLLLGGEAVPEEALRGVCEDALAHARSSAGLERLPAIVRLRAARHRAGRVS